MSNSYSHTSTSGIFSYFTKPWKVCQTHLAERGFYLNPKLCLCAAPIVTLAASLLAGSSLAPTITATALAGTLSFAETGTYDNAILKNQQSDLSGLKTERNYVALLGLLTAASSTITPSGISNWSIPIATALLSNAAHLHWLLSDQKLQGIVDETGDKSDPGSTLVDAEDGARSLF